MLAIVHRKSASVLFAALPHMLIAGMAMANPLGNAYCRYAELMADVGNALKILALIIFGLILLFSKASWEKALLHIAAGAILIGAGEILVATGATDSGCT